MTVLCTREILGSSWCLGEITTAKLYGVPTVPVHFSDFVPVDDAFIDKISTGGVLTEFGLSLPDVQGSVRWLMSIEAFIAPETYFEEAVTQLALAILDVHPGLRATAADSKTGDRLAVVVRCRHVIVVDLDVPEAVAAARIYQKLVRPLIAQDALPPESLPQLLEVDVSVDDVEPDAVAAILCSSGCFASTRFLVSLMGAIGCCITHVVPVVCSDDFVFPTAGFYDALEVTTRLLCRDAGVVESPRMLFPFLTCVFKKICSRLSTKSSLDVLKLEVSRIYVSYTRDASLSGYHLDDGVVDLLRSVVMGTVAPMTGSIGSRRMTQRHTLDMEDDPELSV